MGNLYPNNAIEIVETGQVDNINGHDAELAPKINYPDEYSLRDIYRNKWKTTAFYIRLIPSPENLENP